MSLHLIIDGYNLVRQTPHLRINEKKSLEHGRNMLVKKLLAYQRMKKHRITLVFDGWEEGNIFETRGKISGIEIIFSRQGEKADEVIKRLAAKTSGKAAIITSDRDLGHSCSREGCKIISAQEFSLKLELADYQNQKGETEEIDQSAPQLKGTKKKGPSRRLSKADRRRRSLLKKL